VAGSVNKSRRFGFGRGFSGDDRGIGTGVLGAVTADIVVPFRRCLAGRYPPCSRSVFQSRQNCTGMDFGWRKCHGRVHSVLVCLCGSSCTCHTRLQFGSQGDSNHSERICLMIQQRRLN
jgi:hypothetical protein